MSGSRSQSRSRTRDITPPEFKALRGPFAAGLSGLLATGGGEFGGDLVAPITAAEESRLAQLSTQADDLFSAILPEIQATARGDFLANAPSNPFLRGGIDFITQSVNDAFDQEAASLRTLFSRAGQPIQESSPFSTAQSRLEIDRQDRLTDQIAGLVLPFFESERQRQASAVDQARSALEAQQGVLEAVALPRLIADLGVERGQQLFTERLNRLLGLFGILESATFRPGEKSGSKTAQGGVL